jgi:YidC/Oxa1 family membrane protein insertase
VCTYTPDKVEAPPIKDERTPLAFPGKFTATFSTHNGSLVSWQLADKRFAKDDTKGELLTGKPETGAFQIGFWRGSSRCLPEQTEWTLDKSKLTDTQVVYTWPPQGSQFESLGIQLQKTFTIVPEAYVVRMAVNVTVTAGAQDKLIQQLAVTTYAFQDPKVSTEGGMQVAARVWNSSTLKDDEILHSTLQDLKDGPTGTPTPRYEPNIKWTGFEHPYLLAAYAPKRNTTELIAKHTYPLEPYGLMRTDIKFNAESFDAKAAATTHEVVSYLGPKNYNLLEQADSAAGFETGFKETIDLGWFAFIGRPLMWLLFKFQSVLINWGLAIMLLTVLVKGLTLFWTTKSMRSMKAMAALAPQMKQLQEKYKDDKQRIQAETMALYKQHNVNPIAGCLPILLQMPIWIALYRMLSSAGELYQQPFIPGWIDDLTNTDPFYILPIILVVTMFVQARLTPATGDSRQQKFLQYGMPLMFGVMSFFFPAGLTLYIFTNTILSAVHSIYMNKYDKKSLAIVAKMKKAAEDAAASAKPAAGTSGKKTEKNGKPVQKKPVIDVASVETPEADGDDAESGATAATGSSTTSGPARQRQRRKKRRR